MKSHALLRLSSSLLVVCASSLALADGTQEPMDTPPARADAGSYVTTQVALVTSDHRSGSDVAFEGGYRLGESPLWLHGKLAYGGVDDNWLSSTQVGLFQARLGVEARTCQLDGAVCELGGVDAGYQRRTTYTYEGEIFVDQHLAMTTVDNAPIVAARAGLDMRLHAGLRIRPEVELVATQHGYDGVAAGGGLAYQW